MIFIMAFALLSQYGLDTGELNSVSATTSGRVMRLADLVWSPNGDEIAVASTTGVWLYRPDHPASQPRLFQHQDTTAEKVSYSPDGNLLAAVFFDGAVVVWDLNTSQQMARLKETTYLTTFLGFSPDGETLLAGTWTGSLHLWDVSNPDQIRPEFAILSVDRMVMNMNTDWTIGVSLPHSDLDSIHLWRLNDQFDQIAELNQFEAHSNIVDNVEFDASHSLIATASYRTDDGIRLWDDQTGERLATIDEWSESIQFSPDGKLLATDAVNHLVKLWSVDQALEEGTLGAGDELAILQGHTDDVQVVAFSPDGHYLASVGYDWTLRIWNVDTQLEESVIDLSDITHLD